MTTAHNIVPAPAPAFVRPSGGGGPTVRTKPWPEWAMLRARRSGQSCLPNSRGLEPPGPMPGFQQHDWLKPDAASPHRRPALLLLPGAPAGDQSKRPHRQAVASPGQGPVLFMRRRRRAAAGHDGRPRRVRGGGKNQQHGGEAENQALLRRMQPLPPPAVPRPDLPRDRSEAPGPTGRMLQYHQYQPAAPLCQMLRRGGGQSVCSGDAAHDHRRGYRREKNTWE